MNSDLKGNEMVEPELDQASQEELEATASLAALGMLTPREASVVRPRQIRRMEEAVASLVAAIAPAAPRPSVRDRLMARVAAYEELRSLADVRRNEGGWLSAGFPGVDVRPLFRDRTSGQSTVLIRMEPGAKLPTHSHGANEQCLVLEGDIRWGEVAYEAGDFVVMAKDTTHPELHSKSGNLLLIISGHNEYAHA